jgi:hypothetical protein
VRADRRRIILSFKFHETTLKIVIAVTETILPGSIDSLRKEADNGTETIQKDAQEKRTETTSSWIFGVTEVSKETVKRISRGVSL